MVDHGFSKYTNERCRCEICRKANAEHARLQRKRAKRKRGNPRKRAKPQTERKPRQKTIPAADTPSKLPDGWYSTAPKPVPKSEPTFRPIEPREPRPDDPPVVDASFYSTPLSCGVCKTQWRGPCRIDIPTNNICPSCGNYTSEVMTKTDFEYLKETDREFKRLRGPELQAALIGNR
jgi:hypothetical protein